MRYVICYDIADDKRRKRVADVLDSHGDRIQESVFEIFVSRARFEGCLEVLESTINQQEDRLAIYALCASCDRKAIYFGVSSDSPRVGEEEVFIV